MLRIASGDIIDVDTLLTNTPTGLAKAGVPDDKIQASLKAIVSEVTGERRGPGGHILTGPVYVEGAEPGDVLEVKILSIELPIDYGYNGCSGYLPENCETGVPREDHPLDRQEDDGGIPARHRDSAEALLRQHGRCAGAGARPPQQQSAGPPRRQSRTIASWLPAARSISRCSHAAPCSRSATDTWRRATARWIKPRSRLRCAGESQLTVRKDMKLKWPRAETATDYISMATDPDLVIARPRRPSRR